jgi:quinol-cytochrome oxidoreductase complex cytochrome b subunit
MTQARERIRSAGRCLVGVLRRIYVSIFRGPYPQTPKQRLAVVVNNLVLHVHPTRVYRRSLRPTATLGLGLLSFYLFVLLWVSGVFLMFYYEPSTAGAYGSIQDLQWVVPFGRLVRNLHRWAGEAMVIVVVLHMCRVFYTAAYKPPREFNWILGVGLLLLTLALSFTGYLLPWDQLSFWAITVGTNIVSYAPFVGPGLRRLLLGGAEVGREALLRFYTLHVIALPTLGALLINYHIWRVIKDGGLAHPEETGRSSEPEALVQTFPTVPYLELLVLLVLSAGLLVVSILWNAPLEEIANPEHPNNPAKAPWYFLGLQELVSYSAFWGGVVVPAGLTVFLIVLPYVDPRPQGVGVWFARERLWWNVLWTAILVFLLGTIWIGLYCRGPNWAFYWPWRPWPGPE